MKNKLNTCIYSLKSNTKKTSHFTWFVHIETRQKNSLFKNQLLGDERANLYLFNIHSEYICHYCMLFYVQLYVRTGGLHHKRAGLYDWHEMIFDGDKKMVDFLLLTLVRCQCPFRKSGQVITRVMLFFTFVHSFKTDTAIEKLLRDCSSPT